MSHPFKQLRNRMKRRKYKRDAAIVILPVSHGVDVFTGKGWSQWTRFDTSQGFPKLVAGVPLSEDDYNHVFSFVTGG